MAGIFRRTGRIVERLDTPQTALVKQATTRAAAAAVAASATVSAFAAGATAADHRRHSLTQRPSSRASKWSFEKRPLGTHHTKRGFANESLSAGKGTIWNI